MYVYYENDLWKAYLSGDIFEELKKSNPYFIVEIEKDLKTKKVFIHELEDHSVIRNLVALSKLKFGGK